MKPMTIKDLARLLNVSPSTVSRALNDHPDISADVRRRVKQLANELQFKPNSLAANFRKKQSKMIAIILPKIYRSFIPDVIEGITKRLKADNYQTLILITEDQLLNEVEAIKQCCDLRVDGILISLSNQTKDLEHLNVCKQMNIPVVLFDNTLATDEYATVHINDTAAAAECAEFLNSKKCKNVSAIYGPEKLSISQNRRKGFSAALLPKIKCENYFAQNSLEAFEIAKTQLLKNEDVAFFGISDEVLLGIVSAINEFKQGKKSIVVGFSDGLTLPFLHKELNYIYHDGKIIGTQAADQILKSINNEQYFDQHLEIPVQLY